MPVEWRAGATSIGVKLLLLGQFCAAAIDQPHERHVQTLCQVRNAQDVLGLSGQPGTSHNLVVKTDDDRPAPLDLRQAVDDIGRAFFIVERVI